MSICFSRNFFVLVLVYLRSDEYLICKLVKFLIHVRLRHLSEYFDLKNVKYPLAKPKTEALCLVEL